MLVLIPSTAEAKRSVPRGFVGVVGEGPLLNPTTDFNAELDQMVQAGVETLRISFPWIHAQPFQNESEVPPTERAKYVDVGGVPTDWSFIDGVVRASAMRGLKIMPVVVEAPAWAAEHPGKFGSPPKNDGAYADFVVALAKRYGNRGTFWTQNPDVPKVPLEQWQLWTEPNIPDFWSDQPSAKAYVKLLKTTTPLIRKADPKAKVILSGLVNESWKYLDQVYKAGGRKYFDVVAVHPFTARLSGVITILKRTRTIMTRHHDAKKPMVATELTWSSAANKLSQDQYFGFEVDELHQAARVRVAYQRLAAERRALRLEGAYWFSWLTQDSGDWTFYYAGLRSTDQGGAPRSKPALQAFKDTALALEGCKSKNAVATSCNP